MSPWLSLPLTFAAALMMMFGAGKWRRWLYLFLFLSIPATLWGFVAFLGPGSGKEEPILAIVAVAIIFCALLRIEKSERIKPPKAERSEPPRTDEY